MIENNLNTSYTHHTIINDKQFTNNWHQTIHINEVAAIINLSLQQQSSSPLLIVTTAIIRNVHSSSVIPVPNDFVHHSFSIQWLKQPSLSCLIHLNGDNWRTAAPVCSAFQKTLKLFQATIFSVDNDFNITGVSDMERGINNKQLISESVNTGLTLLPMIMIVVVVMIMVHVSH